MKGDICKFLMIWLLILPALSSKSQEQFFKYKLSADKVIKEQFDTSVTKTIWCKKFYCITSKSSSSSYPSYEKFKFDRDKFITITFTYTFFSRSINNPFSFEVTLNTAKKVINIKAITDSIPLCIRKNLECDFIPKNKAIQIAIADSIKHSDNLSVTFDRAPNQPEYYWIIESDPKIQETSEQGYGGRWGSMDFRYINAETGKIISRAEFFEKISSFP